MDLSIKIENTTLYIRVAVLIKGTKGYLFEKSSKGYIFTVGGKVKLNESSLEAVVREVEEELGFTPTDLNLKATLENFYSNNGENVHEICFVYEVGDVYQLTIPENFIEVSPEDINSHDVRPKPIIDLVTSNNPLFKSIIVK
jgi:8-oxo-dGTP pyrophosphatase MutT (NUDIX family)